MEEANRLHTQTRNRVLARYAEGRSFERELLVSRQDWDRYELTDELESYLREVGTPEEILGRERNLVSYFRDVFKTLPPESLSDEEQLFVNETMTILGKHLSKLRAQAEWAVAMLTYEGFSFDRAKNRLERLTGSHRLRRQRFTDDVLSFYDRTGRRGNTRAVRVQISLALEGVYPKEMLSPRAYFPIWHAIRDHLAPRPST